MTNNICVLALLSLFLIGCKTEEDDTRTEFFPKIEQGLNDIPHKENVWVFILAGQSNMAGRAKVEPLDTIPDPRILTINKDGRLIMAKEPLHFYEPARSGLDCGLSFGKELIKHAPDSISVLLLPTAVGSSSIDQWIHDSTHRKIALFSNFKEKAEIGKTYGTVQGILWHQGENDTATKDAIELYDQQLQRLFTQFREQIGIHNLPIFIGELGSYSKNADNWLSINEKIRAYTATDPNAHLIKTDDLIDVGDRTHFNSDGQRLLGQRFADEFINQQKLVAHNQQP